MRLSRLSHKNLKYWKMANRRVRLAISPCPNDTFMFDAIINRRIDLDGFDIEVTYLDIEQLNAAALERRYDITKCSTAILAAVADKYALLDSGSALGRGNGPLLVSRSGEMSPLRRIAVPGVHTTANRLVMRLFPEIEERVPMLFSEIAEAVERGDFDGGVLIHEGRFVYHKRNLELVADLGLEWEARMGLPLPLGSIIAATDMDDATRQRFESLLRRSIEFAFAHPAISREFIKMHAQEIDDAVIDSHIALFVNEYSLSLGDEGRRAVEALM